MESPMVGEAVWGALRGFRNGVLYGTRIRSVDTAVKLLLYHRGDFTSAVNKIVDGVFEHSSSLGMFVAFYKGLCEALRQLSGEKVVLPWHSGVAGFIGGYYVWGKYSRYVLVFPFIIVILSHFSRTYFFQTRSFNEMLNLYLYSRILYALSQTIAKKSPGLTLPGGDNFRIWGAGVWAVVMYQFQANHPLQRSLRQSMSYLYNDC